MFASRAGRQTLRAVPSRSQVLRPTAAVPSTRCYAQAASQAAQDSKPPIALFGIDGTYASALYTAAAKSSALEPTAKALTAMSNVFKKDPKLPSILAAPTLTATDKSQIINELGKAMGSSMTDTVRNFLKTLADNNRLGILEGVCEKFGELVSVWRGEVECVVTSAAQLDNKTLTRLENSVAKSEYVGAGKKLKVTNKVNPDILGGLVVEISGRTIDLSVSSKIAKMNKLLTDTL
ncbi:MAG: ATP synthase F0 subcomplex subunit OSCP atp5 [Piccolia ochrophora]|nr:MAG: ATP synthase F0 subcomplex subunit OSCP atp5 [Piccolia ochrophora]